MAVIDLREGEPHPPIVEFVYPPPSEAELDIQHELHARFPDQPVVEAMHIGALWTLSARHFSSLHSLSTEHEKGLILGEHPAVIFDSLTRQVANVGYLDEDPEPTEPLEILHQALCEGFAFVDRPVELTHLLADMSNTHMLLIRGEDISDYERHKFATVSIRLRRVLEAAIINSIRPYIEAADPIPDDLLHHLIADLFLDGRYFRNFSPIYGRKSKADQLRARLADQIMAQREANYLAQAEYLSQLILPRPLELAQV